MINLVLFGPPGSGKGTQAEIIVREEKLTHISTGDIFRRNIKEKTDLGLLAVKYMSQGQLVPDQVTIDLLSTSLDGYNTSNGFIFDGFPRTITQAEAFNNLMVSKSMYLSMALFLEVSENTLVQRLLNRGIDSGRSDDQDEGVIRNRIQVYEQQTSVLKDYYAKKLMDSFYIINGEADVHDISQKILSIISSYKPSL